VAKTIRFGDLVRTYGRPEPVTLWTDPKRDPRISKAIRENRVLTVHQEPTSKKKDFGEIGFYKTPFASYFVFPRPLPKNDTSRVIGINYQLAEEASTVGRPLPKQRTIKARKTKHAVANLSAKPGLAKRPKPKLKSYNIVVRRTATLDAAIDIKAENEESARAQAAEMAKRKRFELTKAVLKVEVIAATVRNNGTLRSAH